MTGILQVVIKWFRLSILLDLEQREKVEMEESSISYVVVESHLADSDDEPQPPSKRSKRDTPDSFSATEESQL